MTTFYKNLAVGLTMLVGLVLLGVMILLFGELPIRFFQKPLTRVFVLSDTAEGMSNGAPITFRGVSIGRVLHVERTTDHALVRIVGEIDNNPPLPANLRGFIKTSLLGGSASLNLDLTDPEPAGQLQADATITAQLASMLSMPREFNDLAVSLTDLSKRLSRTVDELNDAKVVGKVAKAVDSINSTVTRAGEVVDELKKITGDPAMRQNITQTLANFREVSENARVISKNLETFSGKLDKVATDFDKVALDASTTINKAGGRVDEIARDVNQRLAQVAQILQSMQAVAAKVEKGEGTAGKLINDPRLYEGLLDSSRELTLTIKDLRRLIEQWEQEGVSFKLGGKK